MMVNTYETTNEHDREWIRQVNQMHFSLTSFHSIKFCIFFVFQWAKLVLRFSVLSFFKNFIIILLLNKFLFFSSIEQIVDAKEKLKQQKNYTHFLNNGGKALIVRWKQDVS